MTNKEIPSQFGRGELSPAALEILRRACLCEEVSPLLVEVVPIICAACGADYAVVAEADGGQWVELAHGGARKPLPTELLATAADKEGAAVWQNWIAVPMVSQGMGEVLAAHFSSLPDSEKNEKREALAY